MLNRQKTKITNAVSNGSQVVNVIMLGLVFFIAMLSAAKCHYAECHNA
jgi:hypothetical protein